MLNKKTLKDIYKIIYGRRSYDFSCGAGLLFCSCKWLIWIVCLKDKNPNYFINALNKKEFTL